MAEIQDGAFLAKNVNTVGPAKIQKSPRQVLLSTLHYKYLGHPNSEIDDPKYLEHALLAAIKAPHGIYACD